MKNVSTNAKHFVLAVSLLGAQIAYGQSPYTLSWKKDGAVLAALGAFAGMMVLTDKSLPGLTPEEVSALSAGDVNSFDRGATYNYSTTADNASTVLEYGLIISPLALFADQAVRHDAATFGAMYLEMVALAGVIPRITKGAVDRPRPFVYNPDAPLDEKTAPDARKSFFSQHATFSFASAVFLSVTYADYFPHSKLRPWIWAGSLGAATTVAILRVTAGQHFPTDVIVGAAVGSAIGYVVPLIHRSSDSAGMSTSSAIVPGGAVISVRYSF